MTLRPIIDRIFEACAAGDPDAPEARLSDSSSGEGIEQLVAGQLDVARVSRDLTSAEVRSATRQGLTLKNYLLGYGAVAVVAHPDTAAAVRGLTCQQLRDIFFTGAINDWSQLTPDLAGPIRPVAPDYESGTAATFIQVIGGDANARFYYTLELVGRSDQVIERAAGDPRVLAVAPNGGEGGRVAALAVGEDEADLVEYSPEMIRTGQYPLTRPLFLVVRYPVQGAARWLIERAYSRRGQATVASEGLVPLLDFEPLAAAE